MVVHGVAVFRASVGGKKLRPRLPNVRCMRGKSERVARMATRRLTAVTMAVAAVAVARGVRSGVRGDAGCAGRVRGEGTPFMRMRGRKEPPECTGCGGYERAASGSGCGWRRRLRRVGPARKKVVDGIAGWD